MMEDTMIVTETTETEQTNLTLPILHPIHFLIYCHRCGKSAGLVAEGYSWCFPCYHRRRGIKDDRR